MRYQCERCKAELHSRDPEHVCKDIKARHERQEKAVALIEGVLRQYQLDREMIGDSALVVIEGENIESVALAIIKALAGRDLGT